MTPVKTGCKGQPNSFRRGVLVDCLHHFVGELLQSILCDLAFIRVNFLLQQALNRIMLVPFLNVFLEGAIF